MDSTGELRAEIERLKAENQRLREELCTANYLHEKAASALWDLQEAVAKFISVDKNNHETA